MHEMPFHGQDNPASTNPAALDQARIHLVYAVEDGKTLMEGIELPQNFHTWEHAAVISLGGGAYQRRPMTP